MELKRLAREGSTADEGKGKKASAEDIATSVAVSVAIDMMHEEPLSSSRRRDLNILRSFRRAVRAREAQERGMHVFYSLR